MDKKAWYIDSGASDGISCDLSYFTTWKRLPKPILVVMGNSSIVLTLCIGTILLRPRTHPTITLRLTKALYAPKLGCNLLSVSSFTHGSDSTYSITFDNSTCTIIDKANDCQ